MADSTGTHGIRHRASKKKAVVVGAGFSGLTAAYRLQKAGFEVMVLESTDMIGGRAQTVVKDGYTIDTAASAIAESYVPYKALLAEMGLSAYLKPASPINGIVRGGKIYSLNTANLYLSAAMTPLLSWASKFKLILAFFDVFKAKWKGQLTYTDLERAAPLDFESSRQYALRRLNTELADYFCDPIVRAMQLTNSEKVSKVEFFSGIANIFDVKLYGLEGGVNRLAQALAQKLTIRTGATVTSVKQSQDGVEVWWSDDSGSRSERVDACVVACPSPAAARICPDNAAIQTLNQTFIYNQSITVAFGTSKQPDSKAYIVQVPKRESADIAMLFLEHNKLPDAAPAGHGLAVAIWEEAAAAAMMDASDEAIIARTRPLLERVLPEIAAHIDMVHVTRWPTALPFSRIGTFKAIGQFNAATNIASRLQFACDYVSATGQSNAVEAGNRAARNILSTIRGY